jgi:hypothetical protein
MQIVVIQTLSESGRVGAAKPRIAPTDVVVVVLFDFLSLFFVYRLVKQLKHECSYLHKRETSCL